MTVHTSAVRHVARAAVVAAILLPHAGMAQSLAQRVASAPDGAVQFAYAARPGVCGNGRTYYSINGSMWFGSMNDNTLRSDPCQPGPVRVVLGRAGKEIVDVRAGEVLHIPSHVWHQAEALEDTLDVDVFSPPRQDWIDKTDSYLRGSR